VSLDILFAAERLLPAHGGAERFAVELLAALGERHRVRAVTTEPPAAGPYWRTKRLVAEELGRAVATAHTARPASLVVTQLHGAPGAVAAAHAAGVPTVVLLPSYEALCKLAFDAGSACVAGGCAERCPAALALDREERDELARSRDRHAEGLARATELVAPSSSVAQVYADWCGRLPHVVAPVAAGLPSAEAAPDGHVLLAAARWHANKGADLLEPLVASLPERRFVVTDAGLDGRLAGRPYVTLTPPRPVAELLHGAALALVPSQWQEPFGRIAFEAMSAGVPCLASARGGLAELVPRAQLVEDAADPEAWAAAVRALSAEASWRAAQAQALAGAAAVLAEQPLRRLEALLLAAASR
jgi:glycosyltransferase involved in cell wall biosynthesis